MSSAICISDTKDLGADALNKQPGWGMFGPMHLPINQGPQTPAVRLFYYIVLQANPDKSKSLLVALRNNDAKRLEYSGDSAFRPGELLATGKEGGQDGGFLNLGTALRAALLGYYCDKVEVKMLLNGNCFVFQGGFPEAANEGGSTGHSDSVNLGSFGDTLTAGISHSDTVGRSIKDFALLDSSSDTACIHSYELRKCADGTDYSGPDDLFPPVKVDIAHVKPVRGVPELARTNFPLYDYGIWTTKRDQVYDNTVTLTLEVTAHMVMVMGGVSTTGPVSTPGHKVLDKQTLSFKHSVDIDLSQVSA
ncbi:hypothetical protein [Pseudomarimonas arenosa]|uniref:Uncharacterized protein n=1 Tax=Pseudomarimonas arenosa TaxID=2774145 RepID=A0AAW3ZMJ3_9GAMM|nr:hypothetical protein [Pseudomarimonas arenosa]MBD8526407.1 hypothetical protein [Pseudomarimonas arenosa]